MRTILVMAGKDLTVLRRDLMALFFIIVFPVLMAVFFGMITGSFNTGSASLSIAVIDEDDSDMSRQFIKGLEKNEKIKVARLDRDEALERVRRGKLTGLVAIPAGFGETAGIMWVEGPAIEVGVDPSRNAEAGMLQGLVMQSMGELVAERFKNPAAMRPFLKQAQQELADAKDVPLILRPLLSQMLGSLDGLMESIEELQDAEADADVDTDSGPGFQIARIESIDVTRQYEKGSQGDLIRKLRSKWDISFPQAMQWGILACSAGFAVTLVRERTQGTMLRLQVAPVTRTQVFTGKAAACFFAVILVISGMVLLGVSLGMRPGNYPFLVIGGLCSAFCFVGVMMLMSVIGRSEESVSGAAWFANIMMAMFGGGMIPLAFMPDFMKTLSNFSPSKWSILAIEGAIWRGFSLGEMLLPCGVLLGIGAVCIAIGVNVLSRTDG